jgi:hypothetical protein
LAQTVEGTQAELARRHYTSVAIILGVFSLSSLLLLIAVLKGLFPGLSLSPMRPKPFKELVAETLGLGTPPAPPDHTLMVAMWLGIAFLGLAAVYLRRTSFSATRLKAIAGLRGVSGLLATLQKTTILVALLGAAISVIGFVSALMSAFTGDMFRAWLITVAVLWYAYPRRTAWRRVVEATAESGGEL